MAGRRLRLVPENGGFGEVYSGESFRSRQSGPGHLVYKLSLVQGTASPLEVFVLVQHQAWANIGRSSTEAHYLHRPLYRDWHQNAWRELSPTFLEKFEILKRVSLYLCLLHTGFSSQKNTPT